jgi:hypothetical protein
MAGNDTSVQDMDNDKDLNLSIGDSNIKGLDIEGSDAKEVKNRYSRVKATDNYATSKQQYENPFSAATKDNALKNKAKTAKK